MKKILFLLLFPCLALAQYQGNANQKITLGEQTTADGLVYRGVASIDTVSATSKITRANKQDTSTYLLLDTVTNLLWHYKTASNGWIQAGGSTLDTATMLLPYYRAGRNTIIQAADVPTLNQNTTGSAATLTTGRTIQTNLASTSAATFNGSANITPGVTGTLPLANGGTGKSSLTANKILVGSGTDTIKSPNNLHWDNINSRLGIGTSSPAVTLDINGAINVKGLFTNYVPTGTTLFQGYNSNNNYLLFQFFNDINGNAAISGYNLNQAQTLSFSSNGDSYFTGGNLGIGTTGPTEKLHVVGSARITGAYDNTDAGAANVFVTTTGVLKRSTSSIKYKTEVEDYNKGLSDVLKLRPVTYKSINTNDNKIYAGFIAEELSDLKLGELLQNNEEGEPDAISYAYMVTLLTKAIQDQQQQIESLKKRLLTLENK